MESQNRIQKNVLIYSLLLGMGAVHTTGQVSSPAPVGASCSRVGEVFGANVLDKNFLLKRDDTGGIETIVFSKATRFLKAGTAGKAGTLEPIDPESIDIGDRLCVQLSDGNGKPVSTIFLLTRPEMEKQQLAVLSTLHRDSAFGTITALDARSRTMELNRISMDGAVHPITVDAPDSVLFRRYAEDAETLRDARASSWEQLHVGDQVYIRGQPSADGSSMRAGLVLLGGLRTFVGTIHSINGLTETIEVQDIRSKKPIAVHVRPTSVFRISPFLPDGVAASTASGAKGQWRLHALEFADLQNGDVVAVLGKASGGSSQAQALAVFVGFGSFDLAPSKPDAQVLWMLDPLNLDIR